MADQKSYQSFYVFVFAWLRGSGFGLRFRIHDSWLAFLFVWHYRAIVQQTSGKLQPWSIWIYTEDKNKLKRGHHSLDKPRTKRLFADDFNMLKFNCLFSCKLQTWLFSQKSWYQSTNTWLAKAPTGTSIGQLTLGGVQPLVALSKRHGKFQHLHGVKFGYTE